MAKGIKRFLSAHFTSLNDDLDRPFIKKADLILKVISISLALLGVWVLFSATADYQREFKNFYSDSSISGISEMILKSDSSVNLEQARIIYEIKRDQIFLSIFLRYLIGISLILISFIFVPAIISLYISFTLPDKIYLRCFSKPNEKEKKRKFD